MEVKGLLNDLFCNWFDVGLFIIVSFLCKIVCINLLFVFVEKDENN